MKLFAQGAEARLFNERGVVIKDRFKKNYRIKEIDEPLRKSRTKREAKILLKLQGIDFPAPKLLSMDKEKLNMTFIEGQKLRDILEKSDYKALSEGMGRKIAILHNNNIIHQDLTTSNMIFKDQIYFIDFGLSFFSHKIEDRAVDLHLLKQALESKHYKIWEECYEEALNAYQRKAKGAKEILKRLQIVEKRGRYKQRR
jgi:TP53 regulating kinase-like protein